jgi:hypothetical protein
METKAKYSGVDFLDCVDIKKVAPNHKFDNITGAGLGSCIFSSGRDRPTNESTARLVLI